MRSLSWCLLLLAATPAGANPPSYGRPRPAVYNAPQLNRDVPPFHAYADDPLAPYRFTRREWTCVPERLALGDASIEPGRPAAEMIGIAGYGLHNSGMIITNADRNFTYATVGFLWTPAGADELTVAFGTSGERKWPDDVLGLLVRFSNAAGEVRVDWNDGRSLRNVHRAPLRLNPAQRSHYLLVSYHFNRLTVRTNSPENSGPLIEGYLPTAVRPLSADARRVAIYNHADARGSFASGITRLDIRALRTWQTEAEKRTVGDMTRGRTAGAQ